MFFLEKSTKISTKMSKIPGSGDEITKSVEIHSVIYSKRIFLCELKFHSVVRWCHSAALIKNTEFAYISGYVADPGRGAPALDLKLTDLSTGI